MAEIDIETAGPPIWKKSGICPSCGSSRFVLGEKKFPCGRCAVEQERHVQLQRRSQGSSPKTESLRGTPEFLIKKNQPYEVHKAHQYAQVCIRKKKPYPWILLRGGSGSGKSWLLNSIGQLLKDNRLSIWETTTYELYEEFKNWRSHGGSSIWARMDGKAGIFFHDIGQTNMRGADELHFWHDIGDYLYRNGKLLGGTSGEPAKVVARYIEPSRLYQRSNGGEYILFLGNTNHRYAHVEADIHTNG